MCDGRIHAKVVVQSGSARYLDVLSRRDRAVSAAGDRGVIS